MGQVSRERNRLCTRMIPGIALPGRKRTVKRMNLLCLCLIAGLFAACLAAGADPQGANVSHQEPHFVRGMDLSMLQYVQDHGVEYRENGTARNPLAIFRAHGVNYVRLRLFVSPNGKEGQVNTLPYTLKLAKRVKQARLRLLLDFHYSDEWADPTHQTIPAQWKGLSHLQLVQRVYTYTHDALADFQREGCLPDMVQVGNEITNGMMWPAAGPLSQASHWNDITSRMTFPSQDAQAGATWDALADFLKAGIRAVRAVDPHAEIMIHIDKGGNRQVSRLFFGNLQKRDVHFDVIGLSYYPFWHGTLSDLRDNLAFLSETYHKDILVAETGYDWHGGEQGTLPFPPTPGGQEAFLKTVIETVAATPGGHGRGVFYWAPEWIMGEKWNGPDWSKTWEHRALFDEAGNMLPGLRAFDLPTRKGAIR